MKRAGKEKQNIGQVPPPLSAAKPSREIGVPAMFLLLAVSVWIGGSREGTAQSNFPSTHLAQHHGARQTEPLPRLGLVLDFSPWHLAKKATKQNKTCVCGHCGCAQI